MADAFSFRIQAQDCGSFARAGILQTPHGAVSTPVFMPVGTQATVKSLSPDELRDCGCQGILANTYHLHLRPGDGIIQEAGGLHQFENWDRVILTDSGGFQVFSLRDISKIDEDGVRFQSYIDGSTHFFSPERVMEIQRNLGADIIMMFDECPPSTADPAAISRAVDRTLLWARRCVASHKAAPALYGFPQALYGIVQGGAIRELRQRCVAELTALNLPGYAIGGLAVGESMDVTYEIAAYTASLLPVDKPRYLMGVGMPVDILECIGRGIDLFDCVLPTRNARNGSAFTWKGKLNIRNAAHTHCFSLPLDESCSCYACRTFSRGYLRHLFMAGEILGTRMLTLHNVFFYMEMVRQARQHIMAGDFAAWKRVTVQKMRNESEEDGAAAAR